MATSEETVYGAGGGMTVSTGSLTLSTGGTISGGAGGSESSKAASSGGASGDNAVMNEKVQALAGSIYE